MTAPSRPLPPRDVPAGPPPRDLDASEESVAAWFEELPGKPPSGLGPKVVGAFRPAPGVGSTHRGWLRVLASAAVVAVVGVVLWAALAARDATVDDKPPPARPPTVPTAVVDDPSVPLYRNLESFRDLDVGRPDEEDARSATRDGN